MMKRGHEMLKREHLGFIRPIRCENLTETVRHDGTVLIRVPVRPRGWLGRLFYSVFRMRECREVELEPVGAFVWSLCDGSHTGKHVSKALCQKYQITQAEADVSLAVFLARMASRGLIRLEPVQSPANSRKRRKR